MAKGKGFDPIADANELAQHNMNPYYWVNKVTSYTYARWMAEKKLALIALPMYIITWALIIWSFKDAAASRGISIWQLIFDFSNSYSIYALVQILFLIFYTAIVLIMSLQLIFSPRQKPVLTEPKRENKKRLPKRRKDYH